MIPGFQRYCNFPTAQYPHLSPDRHLHLGLRRLGRQCTAPAPIISALVPGDHPRLLRRALRLPEQWSRLRRHRHLQRPRQRLVSYDVAVEGADDQSRHGVCLLNRHREQLRADWRCDRTADLPQSVCAQIHGSLCRDDDPGRCLYRDDAVDVVGDEEDGAVDPEVEACAGVGDEER